jgi:hypothetical protein
MTRAVIEVRINIARRELEYWQNLLAKKSCHDCINFQEGGCKLANGIKPPPEVLKTGCDSWDWDSIPF